MREARDASSTMRNTLLSTLLFAPCVVAIACGASPSVSPVVGEPTTVLVPTISAEPPEPTAATETNVIRSGLEWSIFGDTPTVAWAPDGVRLAIANQVNYLGSSTRDESGIDVVDMRTGKRSRVFQGFGYHPVWLSNEAMAFGCSPYECDKDEGLFLMKLGGRASLVMRRGVYHTRAGTNGSILFFSGFPEYQKWMRFDLGTSSVRPIAGSPEDSWTAPENGLVDQCPTKVGSRRVSMRGGKVVLFDEEKGEIRTIVSAPPWHLSWPEDRGDIQPCLSPDGRFVVYFSQRGGDGIVGIRPADGT